MTTIVTINRPKSQDEACSSFVSELGRDGKSYRQGSARKQHHHTMKPTFLVFAALLANIGTLVVAAFMFSILINRLIITSVRNL